MKNENHIDKNTDYINTKKDSLFKRKLFLYVVSFLTLLLAQVSHIVFTYFSIKVQGDNLEYDSLAFTIQMFGLFLFVVFSLISICFSYYLYTNYKSVVNLIVLIAILVVVFISFAFVVFYLI